MSDHKNEMERRLQVAIVVAGLAVAIGDVLIKKVSLTAANMSEAFVHPLIAAAPGLYAFYATTCVLIGRFLFGEQITLLKGSECY